MICGGQSCEGSSSVSLITTTEDKNTINLIVPIMLVTTDNVNNYHENNILLSFDFDDVN